jgi:hypothetical protein
MPGSPGRSRYIDTTLASRSGILQVESPEHFEFLATHTYVSDICCNEVADNIAEHVDRYQHLLLKITSATVTGSKPCSQIMDEPRPVDVFRHLLLQFEKSQSSSQSCSLTLKT